VTEQFDSVGGENITGMTFGDYRILSRLDGGAQGDVFKAEQISLRRDVALKALAGSHLAGKSARSRFLREGALIAKLSHPYIVPVYQAGDCDGLLYYTMELVQGGPQPEAGGTHFPYWIEGNGGAMFEPHQTIPIRVLPPLNGRQPKLLTWQISSTTFSHTNNADMREHSLQTMQRAGLNHVTARAEWLTELAAKYGMHSTQYRLSEKIFLRSSQCRACFANPGAIQPQV